MTLSKGLNGWQRLLVLLTIAWAIPVAIYTSNHWPQGWQDPAGIKTQWANAKVEIIRRYERVAGSTIAFRRNAFSSKSDDDIIGLTDLTSYPTLADPAAQEAYDATLKAQDGYKKLDALDATYKSLIARLPKQSRKELAEVKARWANERLDLWRHISDVDSSFRDFRESESLAAYRARKFADLSDDDLLPGGPDVLPTGGLNMVQWRPEYDSAKLPDSEGDRARELMQLNARYESIIDELPKRSPVQMIELTVIAWIAPLALLYLVALAIRWVMEGFGRRNL